MTTKLYPSDLTNHQWEIIKDLIPASPTRGRKRALEMRWVINAILYIVVGGVQWRMLPREYPKWKSVYHYFRLWCSRASIPSGKVSTTTSASGDTMAHGNAFTIRCGRDCAKK